MGNSVNDPPAGRHRESLCPGGRTPEEQRVRKGGERSCSLQKGLYARIVLRSRSQGNRYGKGKGGKGQVLKTAVIPFG